MQIHPDGRELGRRWFEEVWKQWREQSRRTDGGTWNLDRMLGSLR